MIVVGLTGSIGMGKSTTAAMFVDAGIPVHDSDAAVHRLQQGAALPAIEAAFPGTVVDGRVDRILLGQAVLDNTEALRRLEAILHPLVRAESDAFLSACRTRGEKLAVLDIPLLFETGGRDRVDCVVVVTAPVDVQRARVLARPGMTAEKFEQILARQVPDSEKRAQADYVIDTGRGLDAARTQVAMIIEDLLGKSPGG